jgi:glycosyltransferase involved in cell wall biosynthesis
VNVAYVCADFGVPVFGHKGASVHVREMVAAFTECGHDVRVYAPTLDEPGATDAAGGPPAGPGTQRERFRARLEREPGRAEIVEVAPESRHVDWLAELKQTEALLGRPTRLRQELRNLLYNQPLRARLGRSLLAERVDLVYERYTLFGLAGVDAARMHGVPHVLEVNAPLAEEQERMRGLELKELARSSERRIWNSTDAVIVVSQRLAETVAACGVPGSRIHVLPNAVDPRQFAPGATAEAVPPDVRARARGRCVIGFVGSLKPWHGVETLFEAFATLLYRRFAVHLVVVGDGPVREALERQAVERGFATHVTFAGAVAHADIPAWLSLMDIATAPYTPHPDFYFSPLKLFEYMAAGVPVVAGRIGQLDELLQHEQNALLHAPGDATALAVQLERLVRDPLLRRRLGAAGREGIGEDRTWRGHARRIETLVRSLSAHEPRSGPAFGGYPVAHPVGEGPRA